MVPMFITFFSFNVRIPGRGDNNANGKPKDS